MLQVWSFVCSSPVCLKKQFRILIYIDSSPNLCHSLFANYRLALPFCLCTLMVNGGARHMVHVHAPLRPVLESCLDSWWLIIAVFKKDNWKSYNTIIKTTKNIYCMLFEKLLNMKTERSYFILVSFLYPFKFFTLLLLVFRIMRSVMWFFNTTSISKSTSSVFFDLFKFITSSLDFILSNTTILYNQLIQ